MLGWPEGGTDAEGVVGWWHVKRAPAVAQRPGLSLRSTQGRRSYRRRGRGGSRGPRRSFRRTVRWSQSTVPSVAPQGHGDQPNVEARPGKIPVGLDQDLAGRCRRRAGRCRNRASWRAIFIGPSRSSGAGCGPGTGRGRRSGGRACRHASCVPRRLRCRRVRCRSRHGP